MYLGYFTTNGVGYSDPSIRLFPDDDSSLSGITRSSSWVLSELLNIFDCDLEFLGKLDSKESIESIYDFNISLKDNNSDDSYRLGRKYISPNKHHILFINSHINDVKLHSYDKLSELMLCKDGLIMDYRPIMEINYGKDYISWESDEGFIYLRFITGKDIKILNTRVS